MKATLKIHKNGTGYLGNDAPEFQRDRFVSNEVAEAMLLPVMQKDDPTTPEKSDDDPTDPEKKEPVKNEQKCWKAQMLTIYNQ